MPSLESYYSIEKGARGGMFGSKLDELYKGLAAKISLGIDANLLTEEELRTDQGAFALPRQDRFAERLRPVAAGRDGSFGLLSGLFLELAARNVKGDQGPLADKKADPPQYKIQFCYVYFA